MDKQKLAKLKLKAVMQASTIRNAEHNYLTGSISMFVSLSVTAMSLLSDQYGYLLLIIGAISVLSTGGYRQRAYQKLKEAELSYIKLQKQILEIEYGPLENTVKT